MNTIYTLVFLILNHFCLGEDFNHHPYEAILPKTVRVECRSYDQRRVCIELYNFDVQPRSSQMICNNFGHYSVRCFTNEDDYQWVTNVYQPYIERMALDEKDPLVGSIDYDYKSFNSNINRSCYQKCPILLLEDSIPVAHLPFERLAIEPVDGSWAKNRYGETFKYQKMTFIDGQIYIVEVPVPNGSGMASKCREYIDNYNSCYAGPFGKEYGTRSRIVSMPSRGQVDLFDSNYCEVCEEDGFCRITYLHLAFSDYSQTSEYKAIYHKYGRLYESRSRPNIEDIQIYSREWDASYREEYDRRMQEHLQNVNNNQYVRACFSNGRCRYKESSSIQKVGCRQRNENERCYNSPCCPSNVVENSETTNEDQKREKLRNGEETIQEALDNIRAQDAETRKFNEMKARQNDKSNLYVNPERINQNMESVEITQERSNEEETRRNIEISERANSARQEEFANRRRDELKARLDAHADRYESTQYQSSYRRRYQESSRQSSRNEQLNESQSVIIPCTSFKINKQLC